MNKYNVVDNRGAKHIVHADRFIHYQDAVRFVTGENEENVAMFIQPNAIVKAQEDGENSNE